jgi:hypothetical protein
MLCTLADSLQFTTGHPSQSCRGPEHWALVPEPHDSSSSLCSCLCLGSCAADCYTSCCATCTSAGQHLADACCERQQHTESGECSSSRESSCASTRWCTHCNCLQCCWPHHGAVQKVSISINLPLFRTHIRKVISYSIIFTVQVSVPV